MSKDNLTGYQSETERQRDLIHFREVRKDTFNDLLALADSFNSDVSKHLKNAKAFKIDDIMKPLIMAVSQFETELEFRAMLYDFQL